MHKVLGRLILLNTVRVARWFLFGWVFVVVIVMLLGLGRFIGFPMQCKGRPVAGVPGKHGGG